MVTLPPSPPPLPVIPKNPGRELDLGAIILPLIKAKSDALGGPDKSCKHWKISMQMVYMVLRGKRQPTKEMLDELGVERVYVPAKTIFRVKLSNK